MNGNIAEMAVNEKIISFLKSNTNFTLATCLNNIPYCANCFYAFDENRSWLVFKSKSGTMHIRQAQQNKAVAGTVTPDKLHRAKIRGIQFLGNFIVPKGHLAESVKGVYYRKYPLAIAFPGDIWAIELTHVKMTDNTLGFGTKIEWKK